MDKILHYVSLWDLFNASYVCVRFNALAERVFKRKYKHVIIDSKFVVKHSLSEFEIFLRTFGEKIESLECNVVSIGIASSFLKLFHKFLSITDRTSDCKMDIRQSEYFAPDDISVL